MSRGSRVRFMIGAPDDKRELGIGTANPAKEDVDELFDDGVAVERGGLGTVDRVDGAEVGEHAREAAGNHEGVHSTEGAFFHAQGDVANDDAVKGDDVVLVEDFAELVAFEAGEHEDAAEAGVVEVPGEDAEAELGEEAVVVFGFDEGGEDFGGGVGAAGGFGFEEGGVEVAFSLKVLVEDWLGNANRMG